MHLQGDSSLLALRLATPSARREQTRNVLFAEHAPHLSERAPRMINQSYSNGFYSYFKTLASNVVPSGYSLFADASFIVNCFINGLSNCGYS